MVHHHPHALFSVVFLHAVHRLNALKGARVQRCLAPDLLWREVVLEIGRAGVVDTLLQEDFAD